MTAKGCWVEREHATWLFKYQEMDEDLELGLFLVDFFQRHPYTSDFPLKIASPRDLVVFMVKLW